MAAVRGVLLQYLPNVPVIDISHMVAPFHLHQASYILAASYRHFPPGSVHVIFYDLFSEKQPRMLLCRKDDHYFLAPDNGVLALAVGSEYTEVWNCLDMEKEHTFSDWLHTAAKVMVRLHEQSVLDFEPCALRKVPARWLPLVENAYVECHVIHIDRFENVVVNFTRQQFEEMRQGRKFRVQFMRNEEIETISNHYSDVREGEKLCRFNGTGYLEIAINRGKAASLFGMRLHQDQHLIYSTIKIFFE